MTDITPSRTTYSEIAELAGVSKATVSRVMNGDTKVHPDRMAAVLAAVKASGYKLNRAARALSTGRTGLIAVVIDDDVSALADPFWGIVTSGISRVLMQNELQTLLLVAPLNSLDGPVAHYLERGEVDGAIFVQVHKDNLVRKLHKQGLPVVVMGTPGPKASSIPYADADNIGGAFQATHHLLSRGCRRVATITGDIDASAGKNRLQGYENAIKAQGFEVDKNLIGYADWTFESAKTVMLRLLARHPDIDGVFAANDLMAIGAIAAIQERGKRVPDDIAVVGFDDSLVAQTHRPSITTVRQDIIGLGAAVAETMLAVIAGEKPTPKMLPTELVIRESA